MCSERCTLFSCEKWRLINCDSLLTYTIYTYCWRKLREMNFSEQTFAVLASQKENKIFNLTIQNSVMVVKKCWKSFSSSVWTNFHRALRSVLSDSKGDKWNLFSNLITRTMQWCWLCTTDKRNKTPSEIKGISCKFASLNKSQRQVVNKGNYHICRCFCCWIVLKLWNILLHLK